MNTYKKHGDYILAAAMCAAAYLLDSLNFANGLHFLAFVDFSFCVVVLSLVFFEAGPAIFVCLLGGILLDAASRTVVPAHIIIFLLYAAAAAKLSGIFYERKSIANVIAQAMLVSVFEAAMYGWSFYPFAKVTPDFRLWGVVCAGNSIFIIAAAAAVFVAGRRFSAYRI